MFSIDDTSGTMTAKGNTIKVDLSNYAKIHHNHRIIDIESLESQLSDKATKTHTHEIDDVGTLRDTLNKKSDTNHTHDIRTISNTQNLAVLNDVNVLKLSVSSSADDKDYSFTVDSQGNLNIFHKDNRIGQYLLSTNDWVLSNVSMKEIDTTLENHYQALTKIMDLMKEHGWITNSINQQKT